MYGKQTWNEHLEENRMSYWQHLVFAVTGGACIILYGVILIMHGIIPCFKVRVLRNIENYTAGKRYKANWRAISDRRRLKKQED
jgi:hypothetical protein